MSFSPHFQAPTSGGHVGPPLVPVALISVALFAASFSSLAWLIAAAVLLPASRPGTTTTTHEGITP